MNDQSNNAQVDKLLEEGMTLYGLGRLEDAVQVWKKVLEISPGNSVALEYLEVAKEDVGDVPVKPAPVEADPFASPEKQAPSALGLIDGIALMKEGKVEDAHTVFREVIGGRRDDPELYGYELLARTHRLARYRELVGDLNAVPRVEKSFDEIKKLDLSKEAGFVFSLVDGIISYEDILALTRMDRLESMGHLAHLIEKGVIRS